MICGVCMRPLAQRGNVDCIQCRGVYAHQRRIKKLVQVNDDETREGKVYHYDDGSREFIPRTVFEEIEDG